MLFRSFRQAELLVYSFIGRGTLIIKYADVAELADAPDLGSGVHDVQVRFLSSAVRNGKIRLNSGFLPFFCVLPAFNMDLI